MARYQEKVLPVKWTAAVLILLFLVLYSPWGLAIPELRWYEGYMAAQMLEIRFLPLPAVAVHGEMLPNAFPLFPMLAAGLHALGVSLELSLRLLAVAGLGGCAVIVFAVTRRIGGTAAAAAAAAMLCGSMLALEKTQDGYCTWIFILLLFSGHLLWYYYAAIRGEWSKAWFAGCCFCAAGFYTDGPAALLFFFAPLIFMRRPLGIFSRLRRSGLALGGGVLLLSILLWALPLFGGKLPIARQFIQMGMLDPVDYVLHLLKYPWELMLRLLPWSLLAWAPFCVALQTLDTVPVFSRFLRTLVITDFFLLWFLPLDETHQMMILLPPLAILLGNHYSILIRRYGQNYLQLCNLLAWMLPFFGLFLLAFYLLPESMLTWLPGTAQGFAFREVAGVRELGIGCGVFLLLLALFLLFWRPKPPLWLYILLLTTAPLLLFWTISVPYRNQQSPHRQVGETLRHAISVEESAAPQVYLENFPDLLGELVYFGFPVRNLNDFCKLPGPEQPVIYLISPDYPSGTERIWRNLLLSPPEYHGKKINLWRGEYPASFRRRRQ